MRRPDDCSLTESQRARVRQEAERALRRADALGRFPTPVSDVLAAAKLEEADDDILDARFLTRLRRRAGDALKRAMGKVIGVFDAVAKLVIVDKSLMLVKRVFVRLHETAHGVLPWQRELYKAVEENDQTIAPEIAELFDREANAFASEVLFQLDGFTQQARTKPFGILVPVSLAKKYGASIYAAVRRYVSTNDRACLVLVLDPPLATKNDGFRCNLRRVVESPRFLETFGQVSWPSYFTPDDAIGAMVPLGKRRMSGRRAFGLKDENGEKHECVAEAFTQTHQVFILIQPNEALRPRIVRVSGTSVGRRA